MLKANPDPTRVEFFTNQLFNFTSYNQVDEKWHANQLFNFNSYNQVHDGAVQ